MNKKSSKSESIILVKYLDYEEGIFLEQSVKMNGFDAYILFVVRLLIGLMITFYVLNS